MIYWALIVEDNEALRLVLAEMLKEVGFEVMTARDGNQAMMALQGVMPNLITLDINIPGMTGLELLHHIRESRGGRRTTVVVLSGDLPSQHPAEAGLADVFLVKPVGMGELVELAERLIKSTDETQPAGGDIREYIKLTNPSLFTDQNNLN